MKNIIALLGLKDGISEDAIVADLQKRLGAHQKAVETIDELKAAARGIPSTVNVKELEAKLLAGLTKDQALEVLANQSKEDAANAPKSKK